MDTATEIVLGAIIVALAIVLVLRLIQIPRTEVHGIQLACISIIWVLLTLGGEFLYGWAGNATCSKYLGCVDGFAGYDAFEHLFAGVMVALAIVWLCERYPTYSILPARRWKAALVLISVIAFVSVGWEIVEYVHDTVRLDILHQPLFNWRLHIDQLDQPNNSDTMGDLTFDLFGGCVGFLLSI